MKPHERLPAQAHAARVVAVCDVLRRFLSLLQGGVLLYRQHDGGRIPPLRDNDRAICSSCFGEEGANTIGQP